MNLKLGLGRIFTLLLCIAAEAHPILPSTRLLLNEVDQLQISNRPEEATALLDSALKSTTTTADLAYLYAYRSSIYTGADSLLKAKELIDLSMENAETSGESTALAVAYRARAFLNNALNNPDKVVNDALDGLKWLENNDEDPATKYYLNYLLYGAYSRWDDGEKMSYYIRQAREYAGKAKNINLRVNANNGSSSMYLTRYRKTGQKSLLDSSFQYLNESIRLQQLYPAKVSGNTFAITCINLANFYLEFAEGDLESRERTAFEYLQKVEDILVQNRASSEKWMNVYGIKSGFAKKNGNLLLAEQYLLKGLDRLKESNRSYAKLEYSVNKDLAEISSEKGNSGSALAYQKKAEELLRKSFNEQHAFNAQKLEIEYESQKKDQELAMLKERDTFRKKQNQLYGGIAITLAFGLIFLFVSYHFRLKYSVEKKEKLIQEKEDAARQAQMELKLQAEEQARLKAEQELLDLRRQQLEKEVLAHSVIIGHKNETLKQIQDTIQKGEAENIPKLIKEERLMQADFADIQMQVQELHPDFFNRLNKKSIQKLTPLDLKYCTYLYLKMDTKHIAKALHVEPQSVRMFKYRLKQKFGLEKQEDLSDFLAKTI